MLTEQQKIGELIRTARKEKHFTQAELAEKLNVTRDAILTYEKGKVKVIPYEKRVKLAQILNIQPDELLYTNEKSEIQNNKTEFNSKLATRNLNKQEFLTIVNEILESPVFYNVVSESLQEKYKLNDKELNKKTNDTLINMQTFVKFATETEIYPFLNELFDRVFTKAPDTKK